MLDINLLIGQSIVSTITFLINIYVSYKIIRKDSSLFVNRAFSIAIFFLGLGSFMLALANLPIILDNSNSSPIYLQFSYSFVVVSLSVFLIASLYLRYGQEILYSKLILVYYSIFLVVNFIILWFTDAFIEGLEIGDITTSLWFKIFVLGYLILCYIFALWFFFQTFKIAPDDVKTRMKFLFIGWILGGVALVSVGIGDFIRLFDLIGPIFLSISSLVLNYAFKR